MPSTVRFMVLKAISINPIFSGCTFVSLLNFWVKSWLLDKILGMLCKQSYIEQLRSVLPSLTKKWVDSWQKEVDWALTTKSGLARTKKKGGSNNLWSEICFEYLVFVAFFRQVLEKKVTTKIQRIVFFFLSNLGKDQKNDFSKIQVFFESFRQLQPCSVG